jgi:starch-binding outer membrane protein, SusD/RagB family
MKRTNKLIIWFAGLVIFISSCEKTLEVEPQQSIDAETALQNDQDVTSAIIGAYSIMAGGALYGTNLFLQPDLLGADSDPTTSPSSSATRYATWAGTFTGPRQVYQKNMTRDNSEASRTWIAAYDAINTANNVLDALGVVEDPDLRTQIEGEALFVRGILHFELVRLFALPWGASPGNSHVGVVIKTTATKNETQAFEKIPRSTVAEVYTQVINDLTNAVPKLPEENVGRATRFAALAFLSRVYLQQEDYVNALAAADEVIQSGFFALNASVNAVFSNKNTAESIWEIQQNEQNNAGDANDGMATFFASLPGIGRGDVRIPVGFVDTYPPDDLRAIEWFYIGTGARPGQIYNGKWKSFSMNLPVIRIAEMLLNRAEANIRLGSAVGATPAEDLAQIRNPIRTNSVAPAAPTLTDVLAERFLELAHEGHRIHDVRRLRLGVGSYAWNADELVFPIPAREVDATEGIIVQNPGY